MRRRILRPSQQLVQIPAPMGGLNTISPANMMPDLDAAQVYNMIAAELGLRSRLGSREWVTGLEGTLSNQVRSVLPFTGSTENGSNDKLFVTTETGIWDCSESTDEPTEVLTFASDSGDAGYGVSHVVVTSAGHFLLYCDEENGLHVYTESTDTWAAVAEGSGGTEIQGVDPADLVFVTVHKGRVWYVERDTSKAWYTDAGAIYGNLTGNSFNFAGRFKAGGHLVGLWSWTYDGGSGIDDSLVAISGGGDVAIYQGTDPDTASAWGLKGVWQIGAPPKGRKIATDFGGDMLLLSRTGIIPLSRLVVGGGLESSQYATAKVQNLFNSLMLSRATTRGWSMVLHPEDSALMVTVPTTEGADTEQLVMALANKSWSRYRDLPIFSAAAWQGKLYFGTADGRLLINDGYTDGRTLADPDSYEAVQWSVLSKSHVPAQGAPVQVQTIRTKLLSESASPSYSSRPKYNLDFTELASVSSLPATGNTWDSGVWDSDIWGGEYSSSHDITGGTGMGHEVAIACRGVATARTVLVGWDVRFTAGGGI